MITEDFLRTVDDVELAVRDGYRSIEHIKRCTTLSMGTDQGMTGNLNSLVASRASPPPRPCRGQVAQTGQLISSRLRTYVKLSHYHRSVRSRLLTAGNGAPLAR